MSQDRQVPGDIIDMCLGLADDVRRHDWNARAIQHSLRSIRAGDSEVPRRFSLSRLQQDRVFRYWAGILGERAASVFVPLYAPLYHPSFPFPLQPAHPQLLQIVQRAIFWTPVREVRVITTEGAWYEQLTSNIGTSLQEVFGHGVCQEIDEQLGFHFSNISTDETSVLCKDASRHFFPEMEVDDSGGSNDGDPRYEASFELLAPLDDLLFYGGGLGLTKGLNLAFLPALDMYDLGNWPVSIDKGIAEFLCAPGTWKED